MAVSSQIKQAFSVGTTILTSTVRTARWLRREYALEQRTAGCRAWPTPPIEDWDTWLREQLQTIAVRCADTPLLLTGLQERRIWTRMLKADSERVVSAAGMAALAQSAYGLLSSYDAHGERKRAWGRSDADSFRRWAADFDTECARKEWMPRADLERRIISWLDEIEFPAKILLVGFDRNTPAQQKLLQALGEKGVNFAFGELEEAADALYIRAPGQRQEIEACALWVRERLTEDPECRVGVLAPDLGAVRSEIERTFRHVLMPQSDNILSLQPMPFEFSLGLPLAEVPVIHAALMLLHWLHEPLAEEQVTCLLLGGFLLKEEADFLTLAKLDAERRYCGALALETSLHEFLKPAKGPYKAVCERLENTLHFAAANHLAHEMRLPGRWTDLVELLLREAGWPGIATRDTVHFQSLRRWERALDEIALLDFEGRGMLYGDFLKTLASHTQEVIFAPESEGAPVQIMGALEASGQQFDALWFLSADDQSWPPRGRPHPLLPTDVQRGYGMPYADQASDLELAAAVTNRVAASAATIVFSYAERNKDGEMRPSPLLPRDAAWRAALEPPSISHDLQLEVLEESAEIIPWPSDEVAGGSEALKKQAACPFQAFAVRRLFAEPLDRNEWGLSEAERGQLLHDALRRVWMPATGALHTLQDLQASIQNGGLDAILQKAIGESFAAYDNTEGWERAYIESEKRRLLIRLRVWFEGEARRAPFKVIACEERLDHVSVGDLKLRLRVDRVDELGSGGRVLIDYKSGDVKVKDWETPRPKEPQLPLYAVFGGVGDVRGVLFARILAGAKEPIVGSVAGDEVRVLAVNKENKKLARTPFSAERRAEWDAELRRLADGFLRGDAVVDPVDGKNTCQYCGLGGLCRVTELTNFLEDLEIDGEGGDA